MVPSLHTLETSIMNRSLYILSLPILLTLTCCSPEPEQETPARTPARQVEKEGTTINVGGGGVEVKSGGSNVQVSGDSAQIQVKP
jgi:hypothetical protein